MQAGGEIISEEGDEHHLALLGSLLPIFSWPSSRLGVILKDSDGEWGTHDYLAGSMRRQDREGASHQKHVLPRSQLHRACAMR